MDKDEKISVKVFDITRFSLWKYHIEIVFEAKDILGVVKGFEQKPTFPTTVTENRPLTEAEQSKVIEWNKKNTKGRMLISSSIIQKILGKLTRAAIVAAMWKKLQSLHLKKSPESIFTLQARFFDYKMSASDDISSHIQNINKMATVLADLGSPISKTMILSKIICSLPPSYNSIVAAWSNIPKAQ
jgi:hypothetical protein